MKKGLNFMICILLTIAAEAQTEAPDLLRTQWDAQWISVPDQAPTGYQVCLFRKTLELAASPGVFFVHVSADNRYKLFINGELVSLGPARGDLQHWNYESLDIAAHLHAGKNTIAAQVWNEGDWRPEAQISLRTGFILQGATAAESGINTNDTWKCTRDSSYSPLKVSMRTYYVTGPGELIHMDKQPKNWQNEGFQDAAWKNAQVLFHGAPKNLKGPYGTPTGWMLMPSSIPQMEMKPERFGKVLESGGIAIPGTFPTEKTSLTIPAHTLTTIVLDQTYLTNAYPTLVFSGGKSAAISLTYAEALFTQYPAKGKRNETAGKHFLGRKDSIVSDGSAGQVFTTLAFRTYRFVQLTLRTENEPLVLEDIYGTFTGYPFQFRAALESAPAEMTQMLDIGWRTARLCAVETYFDCPYYEQLQYIGDTRIQGLVSIYNSGDERLLRNAINQMDQSRQPEGVTLSRHPSYTPQYIPTFSLWYVGMLHDYSRYGRDRDFIKNKLPGMRQVMEYFRGFQTADGSLKDVPHWMFTDWVNTKGWISDVGPMSDDGTSALLDLQLLWAYQLAADLESKLGMTDYAVLYAGHAARLKMTIQSKYWDPSRKLYADRAEKDFYSQHANALAILTGMVQNTDAKRLAGLLRADTSLAPASIYFKYYLHQALVKAGMGNDYPDWLDIWRENIAMGLTTWAESSDLNTVRSDCHAWGSSPNIEFFRTVLGIDSDGLGFSKVKIEPHLGDLKKIGGRIPHTNGTLTVCYELANGQWNIEVDLPEGITGVFVWKGKQMPLKAGANNWKI
ncbi:MAG: alpha-L-rhamnosidase N-terminal domain-containing protein [Saprospiraceae bacterium]|nr:alpha-L-rhamnosidase N-terminal domain-containing protein [Saprospiraceae bacterium]